MNPDFQSKMVWSSVINIKKTDDFAFLLVFSHVLLLIVIFTLWDEKNWVFFYEKGEAGDFVFVAANNDQISKLYPCVPTFMYTYFYNLDHST